VKNFTPRFAESPLQAMHNFVVGLTVARVTHVIAAHGLDPCWGFLHDGRKPGRFSLSYDAVETLRPALAEGVFGFARGRIFERIDFAQQDGVVRLSSHMAKECAALACEVAPLAACVREVKRIESLL
jgi:CRISPR/Cas system-associated endonuclease Cas1